MNKLLKARNWLKDAFDVGLLDDFLNKNNMNNIYFIFFK